MAQSVDPNRDLRPEDIKLLLDAGIEYEWSREWEESLCKETDGIMNRNQLIWHLSRLSFLAGYKLGKESV